MNGKHPKWGAIVEFVESVQRGARENEIVGHIETCPRCSAHAAEAREVIDLLTEAHLPAVPKSLVDRTMTRLMTGSSIVAGVLGKARDSIRKLQGRVVSNSLRPNFAVRGTTIAVPRMLVFDAPPYAVTISLADCDAERVEVRGQVLPKIDTELDPSGRVTVRIEEREFETHLSPFGEFVFSSVPRGALHIEVVLGDCVIQLAPISDLSEMR